MDESTELQREERKETQKGIFRSDRSSSDLQDNHPIQILLMEEEEQQGSLGDQDVEISERVYNQEENKKAIWEYQV